MPILIGFGGFSFTIPLFSIGEKSIRAFGTFWLRYQNTNMSINKFYAIELNKVFYYVERTSDRDKQLYRLITGICSIFN